MEKPPVSTDSYKGVRDFYPEDMAVQNYIFSTWRKIVEESGFVEYSASILEYADLYKSKGNDEIVNEQMYTFTDKGDREVALRPEMTPSLARMIAAKRGGLKLPLRWYSIPNVFRYERPQRGRRREHWQLNCDLMGIPGIEAEVEIITLAHKIMKAFGAKDEDFVIKINDRRFFDEIFEEIGGASPDTRKEVVRLIDGQEKNDNFEKELTHELGEEKKTKFLELLDEKKSTISLDELRNDLDSKGIKNVVIDTKIARGFDYYTGMIFEVFDTNPENKRSLFGGGRYDNLLEMFGVEPLPTVGFGMGDITIRDFLETHKLPLTALKNS
ncbi:MAG: ATP phosphoribosyltransferase regulatory subunit [Patescibacteria group bacterium]